MSTGLQVRWCHDIRQIPASAWHALQTERTSPFLEYEWLYSLEASGCASPKTGWLPCHLLVEAGGNRLRRPPCI